MTDESATSTIECRSCGYVLGPVGRCPECADAGHVYLFPDNIPRAWLFALVISVMMGSSPLIQWPLRIVFEGSVDAWIRTLTLSPSALLSHVVDLACCLYALWIIFGRARFMRLPRSAQWLLALLPLTPFIWRYVQTILVLM